MVLSLQRMERREQNGFRSARWGIVRFIKPPVDVHFSTELHRSTPRVDTIRATERMTVLKAIALQLHEYLRQMEPHVEHVPH